MGQTPLHIAVQNNNPDIVRILLDHHANTNKFDKFGITPYKYAEKMNLKDILGLMRIYCKN